MLGTDGHGPSDTCANLRRFFEVDRYHVAQAVDRDAPTTAWAGRKRVDTMRKPARQEAEWSERMASILMGLIMGLLGGPAIAMALRMKNAQAGHQKRKEAFLAGKGSDPDAAPFGPHKSFQRNAIIFGLMFAAIGLFIGTLG